MERICEPKNNGREGAFLRRSASLMLLTGCYRRWLVAAMVSVVADNWWVMRLTLRCHLVYVSTWCIASTAGGIEQWQVVVHNQRRCAPIGLRLALTTV